MTLIVNSLGNWKIVIVTNENFWGCFSVFGFFRIYFSLYHYELNGLLQSTAVIILYWCFLASGNLCKLDPEPLGHYPTSFDSFLYKRGNWIPVLSQDCTSSMQRSEKVWRKLSYNARAWAAENSVAIAAVIRTLHFLTALCSLPRTLQCLFCLVSVNWLKRKEDPALKSSGILYNCNTVSHCKCVIYVRYYFKKRGICLHVHTYIPMLSSMKHLTHWLHRTHAPWNTPWKRGAERDAVLSVLFIKITEHNIHFLQGTLYFKKVLTYV